MSIFNNVIVECVRDPIKNRVRVKVKSRRAGLRINDWVQFPYELRKLGRKYKADLEDAGNFYRVLGNIQQIKAKSEKFVMRQPPTPLEREIKTVHVPVAMGDSMSAICTKLARKIQTDFKGYEGLSSDYLLKHVDQISVTKASSLSARSRRRWSSYSGRTVAQFKFPESQQEFETRLKKYDSAIAEYRLWRKENEEKILAIEAKQRKTEEAKEAKRKAKRELAAKLRTIKSQLTKLKLQYRNMK